MYEDNKLDEQKLEMGRKFNTIDQFKELEEQNGDEGKQNPIKDAVGHWTDKQIAENPEDYIRYLEGKLDSATARQDLQEIKELISEISEIEKKYFANQDLLQHGRVR